MKILPYKLRRALTIGAIAGSTLTACDKNANEPQEPVTPTRDIELEFNGSLKSIQITDIKKYADMPDIRYIYMIPKNPGWGQNTVKGIHNAKDSLQLRFDINPAKVRGKGTFEFKRGEPSKIPNDSLWFVEHGWEIKSR